MKAFSLLVKGRVHHVSKCSECHSCGYNEMGDGYCIETANTKRYAMHVLNNDHLTNCPLLGKIKDE